jgi:hypothetical protein
MVAEVIKQLLRLCLVQVADPKRRLQGMNDVFPAPSIGLQIK